MKEENYLSISQFSTLLKSKFDMDPELRSVYLKGEISNYKRYPSGHAYFSLKDEGAIISSIMWSSSVDNLNFSPKEGDEVLAHGKVSIYPQRGSYQLYIDKMDLFGKGNELLKLKELAKKLQNEGLFDESRKRKLKKFPSRIGLITARGSAAIKDMVTNIQNRWPLVDILVFPSLVQGNEAPKELLKAFYLSQKENLDTLIIGRGGGSSEDLSAFNDETLVRALATSNCPTISAVGHEIDFTLTDFVCDLRVSTPTGAAVAAVPDQNQIKQDIAYLETDLVNTSIGKIEIYKREVEQISSRPFFVNPSSIYQQKINDLNQIKERLNLLINNRYNLIYNNLVSTNKRLIALSPYGVLNRGYSMITNQQGKLIASIKDIEIGEEITTKTKDGQFTSTVKNKEKAQNGRKKE